MCVVKNGLLTVLNLKKFIQIFAHEDMGEGDSSLNFFLYFVMMSVTSVCLFVSFLSLNMLFINDRLDRKFELLKQDH